MSSPHPAPSLLIQARHQPLVVPGLLPLSMVKLFHGMLMVLRRLAPSYQLAHPTPIPRQPSTQSPLQTQAQPLLLRVPGLLRLLMARQFRGMAMVIQEPVPSPLLILTLCRVAWLLVLSPRPLTQSYPLQLRLHQAQAPSGTFTRLSPLLRPLIPLLDLHLVA